MRALDQAQAGDGRGGIDFSAGHRQRAPDRDLLELAIDHELKRIQFGGGPRDVVHRSVMFQVIEAFRLTVLAQVTGTGTGNLPKIGNTPADQ
ncbi:hypothetical protein D3C76_1432010 [compost metagenome]